MFESKFRVVSIGIAAENKALDSHELPVAPIEIFPLVDGELMESLDETDVSGVDQSDVEYTVRLKTSSTITATWLQKGSNRVTSPDIRRGERLLLWQYGDSDKYYWTSMGMDDDQRRLETVIYAWSATADIEEELDLLTNMYSMEISTHGKHITLHTTQADGEPFEYTMQLNTKEGLFFITDQDGNSIQLNSAERIIKAINSDATEVTIDKKTLFSYAKDEVRARSDDFMKVSVGGKLEQYVEGDFTQYVKGDYNLQVDGKMTAIVKGMVEEYFKAGQTTLSDGLIAQDGSGVETMSGAAAGNSGLSFALPTPFTPPPPISAPKQESLPPEYSDENTADLRQEAGRYAPMDEQAEVDKVPSSYPEDTKPDNFTGEPGQVSDRTSAQKPTGEVTKTTTIPDGSIDYTQVLGNTDFTIGDLSKDALFSHLIRDQNGMTSQDIVWNMEALAVNVLQPLKDEVGEYRINSGFRAGSGKSQHLRGMAVDIQNPAWASQQYMEVAEWIADNLPCDQLIFEHGNSIWLHISFDATKNNQRGQLLTMLDGNYEPGLRNYYA